MYKLLRWLSLPTPRKQILRKLGLLYPSCSVHAKLLQSCLTPCDPKDCCPPGSAVHGILQARILKWVALQGSFPTQRLNPCLLCLLNWQAGSLPLAPPKKPLVSFITCQLLIHCLVYMVIVYTLLGSTEGRTLFSSSQFPHSHHSETDGK